MLTNQAGNAAALGCFRPLPQLVCGLQLVCRIPWVLLLRKALLLVSLLIWAPPSSWRSKEHFLDLGSTFSTLQCYLAQVTVFCLFECLPHCIPLLLHC